MDEQGAEMLRKRESIEAKVLAKEYSAARISILETLKVFPSFDQASEMILVCDILSSAEMEFLDSGIDWYWVLQLYPSASLAAIESKYQKIVSQLSPVKNDIPGTELALKLAADAFSVLSDPIKKEAFDSKRQAFENTCEDSCSPSSSRLKRATDEACSASGDLGEKKMKISDVEASWAIENENLEDDDNSRKDVASSSNIVNPPANTVNVEGSTSEVRKRRSKLSPKDFARDQVWAVYDGPGSVPRAYVKINYVISPTELSVTYLDPHPMLDQEIHWVEENLPLGCGVFRASRDEANLEISKFSHLVQCDSSRKKTFYRIFPKKGEIWAMYNNWSINWRYSDFNSYNCRVVEILSDYSEENGVTICSLVEVPGFLTFFHRKLLEDGFQITRQLSRKELLSFSHRIPAFTVTGIKNNHIPKGSLHLEPDALPPRMS